MPQITPHLWFDKEAKEAAVIDRLPGFLFLQSSNQQTGIF
jgi:hypothetical protein